MARARVLLVDNNRLVVDLVESYLEDEGYEIDRAYDGLEAIDRVHARAPDIIVTDLIMPKIDGKKLCRYLRQNPETAAIPIIVLSGIASEDREGYREVDADAYLAKCAYDRLLPNIKTTLERLLTAPTRRRSDSIIGIEEIYPRELVKEFAIIKKHYDAILESMAEGVLEVDPAGRVVMANGAAQTILDRREDAVIGRHLGLVFDEGARLEVESALDVPIDPCPAPRELRIRSGGKVVRLRMCPVVRDKVFHGTFVTMEDFTHQDELEGAARDYTRRLEGEVRERTAELERRNAELQAANRLKDEFLGVLSHELRTPITPIKGYLELLKDHPGDAKLFDKALSVLRKQVDHLEHLLTDLLDLTAIEAGRLELDSREVDVNEVARAVADALAGMAAERSHALELDLGGGARMALADLDRLDQVVRNLVTNAIKFSDDGAAIRLRSFADGDCTGLAVEDRGIGIAPQDQSVIFERFRQIDSSLTRRYSGLGIGLTLAKKLVELMGGEIEVSSARGSGSTFTVRLRSGT